MRIDSPAPATTRGAGKALGCAVVFIGTIVLGLLALLGFFLWVSVDGMTAQARLIETATTVDGTVVSSDVDRISSGTSGQRSVSYAPRVSYTYDIDGAERTGGQVFAFPDNGGESWAREIVAKYPAGASVMVHVDPDDPEVAFLERAWVIGPYLGMIAVGVCGAILASIVCIATFLFPRIALWVGWCGAAVAIGAPLLGAVHYLAHARADGAGMGIAIASFGATVMCALPLVAVWQGRKWRRKLRGE